MLARRSERNRSRPLIRLRNERPAICAFSRRKRPGVVCASPQTRKRFEESLRVRECQIVLNPVNEVLVVVAFNIPFISNLEKALSLPISDFLVYGRSYYFEREPGYHYNTYNCLLHCSN